MTTGSDGIKAIIRGRRILLAETVVRMEDTRLSNCVMFGDCWGAWAATGAREKSVECFLADLGAFGINVDQWTIAAQGQWHKTAKQGAERFVVK